MGGMVCVSEKKISEIHNILKTKPMQQCNQLPSLLGMAMFMFMSSFCKIVIELKMTSGSSRNMSSVK